MSSEDDFVRFLSQFCAQRLIASKFAWDENSISQAVLVEVRRYAHADLARLSAGLHNGFSREKYAAYHAYWFSRLQPVRNVYRDEGRQLEVVDISERLAVHLALDLMLRSVDGASRKGSSEPLVWRACSKQECTAGVCFKQGASRFFTFHNRMNYDYLVAQLRYQATEPTSFVSLLEALIIGSCQDQFAKVS